MGCFGSCFEACDPCCKRLGCSCKARGDEPLASIERKRSCTDVPCILIFIFFLVFMVGYIWIDAFGEGDPDRIIYGVDYQGRICGKDSGVKDKKYAFWPDTKVFRFKVCTDDCNAATWTGAIGNHLVTPYTSEPYLDKYCLPTSDGVSIEGLDDASNAMQQYIGDVEIALPIIFASIAIAFAFSFLYIYMMRLCVGVLVWGTIAAIIVGGAICGYVLVGQASNSDLTEKDANIRKGVGYSVWVFTAIFALIIIFSRQRILIAIQVIKSAGRALADMPLMVVFPIWPLIAIVGFFAAWLFACIYIFSAGKDKLNDTPDDFVGETFAAENDSNTVGSTYPVIDYDDTIQNAFAPHFFLLLWVVQIAIYFTFTAIAGSVSDWYFTKRDESGKKIRGSGEMELSNRPVLEGCKRTCRYHLGTIIYAAAIIAIIEFIRWCVRYAERMMSANGKEPNKLQKVLFKVVDCCLWCLECCLDKISRNALIWTSIYGDPFCPAVCGSFKLVWANLMRVAVITFFSAIVTLLGKLLVPLITVGLCGLILLFVEPYKTDCSSPVMPLVLILVLSVAIAFLFLTVYDTAIDTIFLCFLIDEQCNKNSGMMLADPGLRDIVQKYEAQSKELASSMQKKKSGSATVETEAAVQI